MTDRASTVGMMDRVSKSWDDGQGVKSCDGQSVKKLGWTECQKLGRAECQKVGMMDRVSKVGMMDRVSKVGTDRVSKSWDGQSVQSWTDRGTKVAIDRVSKSWDDGQSVQSCDGQKLGQTQCQRFKMDRTKGFKSQSGIQ
jgi:hypothetical protein